MAALAKRFDFIFFPLQDEALAAREGVGLAMDMGLHDLIIECDSLQIVNALNDSPPICRLLGIMWKIRMICFSRLLEIWLPTHIAKPMA